MHRTIRSVALALALPVLAAGAAHARPLAVRPAPAGFLEGLWRWVASYVPAWIKEGRTMDTNGGILKSGGTMDPDGAPHSFVAPLPKPDSGGMMDPDG